VNDKLEGTCRSFLSKLCDYLYSSDFISLHSCPIDQLSFSHLFSLCLWHACDPLSIGDTVRTEGYKTTERNSTEKRKKEARGGMARRAKSKRSMYATFMSGTSNRSTFHIPTLTATSLIHAYLFCVLALLSMPPLPICVLLSSTVVEPLQRGFGSCSSNFYLTTIP